MAHLSYSVTSIGAFFFLSLIIVGLYANTLNPFGWTNRFKKPFGTRLKGEEILLVRSSKLTVRTSVFWKLFAYYKCAWHIVSNVRAGSKAKNKTLDGIIADIHRLRFDPHKPYLISGDHFNVLYPRNLGIFYHSTLDPHTALSSFDWERRQRIYLQTVAFALEAFRTLGDCTTTIVPVGSNDVACLNIYRYPSDSLYGILYGLASLTGIPGAYAEYSNGVAPFQLNTIKAGNTLLEDYKTSLAELFKKYYQRVYDPIRGLIKRDISISSAKDAVLRKSSFYDNVIFWKTCSLAIQLDIPMSEDVDLVALKSRILTTFWSEESGHFIDDLSEKSVANQNYSGDWLVAFVTGFLDPQNPVERSYLSKTVAYITEQKLDMPFPLCYQKNNQSKDEVFFVRFFVPSYGGSGIWSFWGAEFIKLLSALSKFDKNEEYFLRAERHIQSYEELIVRYRGYPEIYDSKGTMFRSPLYRSVRQTGWVVGFVQAQKMAQYIRNT